MRICFLNADQGITLDQAKGATANLRHVTRCFQELGHDVLVVSHASDEGGVLGTELVQLPIPRSVTELRELCARPVPREARARRRAQRRIVGALADAMRNVVVEQVLPEVLEGFRPDLVWERYSRFGVAGGMVSRRLGVQHALNVHSSLAWEGATFRQQALQDGVEHLETVAWTAAEQVIANSREMGARVIDAGAEPARVHAIPNGVDVERFTVAGPAHRPVAEDAVVIGFCGSLKAWHGLDVLAEAFRQLAADPRYHLLIVGDGSVRELEELSKELPGRVTLTGAVPLEEVPAWLRGMDVAVAPYPHLELFTFYPLKILEYMATGRPCVVSRIGACAEIVDENETGLLVPPGDVTALAHAVRQLGEDRERRARLGEAAARRARKQHAWKRQAEKMLAAALGCGDAVRSSSPPL